MIFILHRQNFLSRKIENHLSPKVNLIYAGRSEVKCMAGKVRDAKTGRYVKKEEAKKRPNTTVTEKDKKKK